MGRRNYPRLRHQRLRTVCLLIGAWIVYARLQAELSAANLKPQQASSLLTEILGQCFAEEPNEAVMFGVLPEADQDQFAPDKRDLAICLHDARSSGPGTSNGVQFSGEMQTGMREFLPFAAELDLVLPQQPTATAPPSIDKIAAILSGNIDALLRNKIGGVVLSAPEVDTKSRKITFEISHLDDLSTSTIGQARKLFGSADFQQAVGALVANSAARAAKKDVADTVREQILRRTPVVETIVESEHLGFKITLPPLSTSRPPSETNRWNSEQINNSEVHPKAPPGKELPQLQTGEFARLTRIVRVAAHNSHTTYLWFLLERVPPFSFGSLIFYGQFKTVQGGRLFLVARAVRGFSSLSLSGLRPIVAGQKLKDRLQELARSESIMLLPQSESCFVVRFDRGQEGG